MAINPQDLFNKYKNILSGAGKSLSNMIPPVNAFRQITANPKTAPILGPIGTLSNPQLRQQMGQVSQNVRTTGIKMSDYANKLGSQGNVAQRFIGQQVARPIQYAGYGLQDIGLAGQVATKPSTFLKAPAFTKESFSDPNSLSKASIALNLMSLKPVNNSLVKQGIKASKFTMDPKTLNEVVDASDMIRSPKDFIGQISTGARTQKEAIKRIQERGVEIIERVSARHLPDKQLTKLKSPLAKADALLNLSRENKLADVKGSYFAQPTQVSKGVTKVTENMPMVGKEPILPKKVADFLPASEFRKPQAQLSQMPQKQRISTGADLPYNDIISQAKKQIASVDRTDKRSIKQVSSDLYTQWVDRYNPITKVVAKVKRGLKIKGSELRPEYDPSVSVRKLTGAGGIADYKFRTELEPIIKEADDLKIDKSDLDVYLANKRMAGFGEVGRDVYGADPVKSKQVVDALEAKYGASIKSISDKLYSYQDKGFQEMVEAGFISPETAEIIRGQNPNYAPLQRVMDEVDDYLGLPTRKTMQGSQPIVKIKGSTRKIDSPLENIIANTFRQRAAIEKNNVAKNIANLQNIIDVGFKKVSKSGDDTITVWNNGEKEYYSVGKEIADTAKGLNEENMNALLKIFTAPASLLRQGATGRNPEFMIPNIIRDQLDAGITSKHGYIPFIDYLSGLKSMVANDSVYQKWQRSGSKIDLGEMSGRKTIQMYFDSKVHKKKLFGWLGSALDVMGKYSEQPTRVGLFKKAYKKTGNELLSMMESRDATVDFARMGSKMKVANSIIPFLNVGVQGFDKLIRSVKDHPGKVALNATIYGALPAAMTTLYNLTNHAEEYAEIPQYEKDSNFILVKGRNEKGTVDYISIPKGNVLPVIANPIQSFFEYASKNSGQTIGEFATQFLSSTLPVMGDGQSLKEVGVKTIGSNLPQLVKPITENLMNKSFWKYNTGTEQTKEIVPTYLQSKEPYKQAYEWTPKMYKGIGALLNVSPLQVQNLMEGYLAGYVKVPSQIIDGLLRTSKGEEVDTNQKTILRRFIKETYPSSKQKTKTTTKTPLGERITPSTSASGGELPKDTDSLEILYKDAIGTINSYNDKRVKKLYADEDIAELQQATTDAINLKKKIEKEHPEQVFDIQVNTYSSDGSATVIERTKWASEKLKMAKDEIEYNKMVNKMLEGGVLTKPVADALNDAGIKIDKYTSGGKIESYRLKGKKPKKITIKAPKMPKVKLTKVKTKKVKLPKPKKVKKYSLKKIKLRKVKLSQKLTQ